MCGENLGGRLAWFYCAGSSPRVRGKLISLSTLCAAPVAHPRVCGENDIDYSTAPEITGSSPRVRGKRTRRRSLPGRNGLIPACAGKTPSILRSMGQRGAHPRVCGENLVTAVVKISRVGSSPRVRGKPLGYLRAVIRRGLIPACAGKTTSEDVHYTVNGAHPRVCGENLSSDRNGLDLGGSSPRVRGKQLVRSR